MEKHILFEGKTSIGGMDVDIKIYKVNDDDLIYYEWDYNPHLVDKSQINVHIGGINRGDDLETIFSRIRLYKSEIKKINKIVANPDF